MEETIKDELGVHRIVRHKNGIVTKYLIEPSEKFQKKLEDREKEILARRAEKEKVKAKEKLIQDKMRELAIKELEKEGRI